MNNNSIVADTFEGDEVPFGDVRGIEFNGSMSVPVSLQLGGPIERRAMVRTCLGRRVRILWRKELSRGLVALLLDGGH